MSLATESVVLTFTDGGWRAFHTTKFSKWYIMLYSFFLSPLCSIFTHLITWLSVQIQISERYQHRNKSLIENDERWWWLTKRHLHSCASQSKWNECVALIFYVLNSNQCQKGLTWLKETMCAQAHECRCCCYYYWRLGRGNIVFSPRFFENGH